MTAFDEVRFPRGISFNSSGGPKRRTEIATLASGAEERNSLWANSRREYNAGYGIRTFDDVHAVLTFFEARLGQGRGFRFWDPTDYRSCPPLQAPTPTDQLIATGDGTTATFPLIKTYSSGGRSWTRTIKKPVSGTVRIALGGVEKALGVDFTLDVTTGVIAFLAEHIPAAGVAVTAGFEFDVPVRFATDHLNINLSTFRAGSLVDIPLIELKL